MTSTELCKMCTEYSIYSKCKYKKSCKLQKILKENKKLRAENKELREKIEKLETDKRLTDYPDKVVNQLEERTAFLNGCTKYDNETAEQQKKSYDTMMMYEVKDLVDDLLVIVKEGGVDGN